MKQLRKTKIVGTIGPASEHKLKELFSAGLNVCRINYSHGSYEEQREKTEEIIKLRKELNLPIAMILDMKGPEIRTGMLYTGTNTKVELKDGQKFVLVNEDIEGNEEKVSISYKELYKDVVPGAKILIDDGAIELRVDEIQVKDIVCTVVHGNGLGRECTEPIAIDPDDSNVIYVGGDVASGDSALIKSVDGGKTWKPVKGYDDLGLFKYELKWPTWTDHIVRGVTDGPYSSQSGINWVKVIEGKVYVGTSINGEANIHVANVENDEFKVL